MIGSIERHSFKSYFPRAAAFVAALGFFCVSASSLSAQEPPEGPRKVEVAGIEVIGNNRVTIASILTEMNIRSGDSIGYAELQKAMGRMWATRQFKDVQFFSVPDTTDPTAPITLRVQVEEQPMISTIEFNGLQNIKASTVRDTVGLKAGAPFNPAAVTAAEAMVRSLLADKGFFVRKVEHRLEDVPERPDAKRLVFNVEEGTRVAIADVGFEGNEVFSTDELKGVLDTKEEGFFWFRGGTFDEEAFRADVRDNLPSFYAQNGYIDFTVTGDTLVVDQETGKARLVIRVDEGPQYLLGSFDIRGNRRFPSSDLRQYFEQQRGGLLRGLGIGIGGSSRPTQGEVFDATSFARATTEINSLYHNQGYLYAQVNDVVERVPAEGDEPPRVNVAWEIEEGRPAFINRVRITGNTFTHEDVIRGQLLILPGDLYSEDRLIQSYRRISALGFFETPLAFPQIQPNEGGDVDITFNVKEKQTGSVNFGTALGGVSGVAGFLGYDQPNLFGKAKSGHLRWEFGRYSNNFEASYSDPSILDTRYSGSLSLFSSRDRFFTFQEGRRRRTGVGLRFGVPVLDVNSTRLSIGYSVSRTTYEEFDEETTSTLFSLPPGVQSQVSLSLARTAIDHPLFPTVGSRQDITAEFNGGVLGGDGTFQKVTATGSWYVPVGSLGGGAPGARPIRFTLGLTAEVGGLFGDASNFPFDRFWMGGVQFGRPLRGYDETTVTPNGYIARGANGVPLEDRFGNAYMRLSAEYALRFNDNISISAFYDAGNVWRQPSEINPTRLARGAGVGLTLVTPFGPLGLDYAYGFDKTPAGWQLHFKFGQGF